MTTTHEKIRRGIEWLSESSGLILPYNQHPGVTGNPDTTVIFDTKEDWDNYQWNPPGFYGYSHLDPDPNASPKPVWGDIIDAYDEYLISSQKGRSHHLLDEEATRHIGLLYHPQADTRPEREWQVRLSGDDTTDADAKRVKLIAVHDSLKTRIDAATTVAELETIQTDIFNDSTWALNG